MSSTTSLSYSSARLISNCERKYWHHKVGDTTPDNPMEDNVNFTIGKCFHAILENSKHRIVDDDSFEDIIEKSIMKYDLDRYYYMIKAMVHSYIRIFSQSGWTAIECEIPFSDNKTLGFIDLIAIDKYGRWAIGDLKTAAIYSTHTNARLTHDYQLNLYANFYEKIAETSSKNLKAENFYGVFYSTTTKSKIKRTPKEDAVKYYRRLQKSISTHIAFVPKKYLNLELFKKIHDSNHARSVELRKDRTGESAKQNFSFCENYFKPCDFWKQCHNKIKFEDGDKQVIVFDERSIERRKTFLELL